MSAAPINPLGMWSMNSPMGPIALGWVTNRLKLSKKVRSSTVEVQNNTVENSAVISWNLMPVSRSSICVRINSGVGSVTKVFWGGKI